MAGLYGGKSITAAWGSLGWTYGREIMQARWRLCSPSSPQCRAVACHSASLHIYLTPHCEIIRPPGICRAHTETHERQHLEAWNTNFQTGWSVSKNTFWATVSAVDQPPILAYLNVGLKRNGIYFCFFFKTQLFAPDGFSTYILYRIAQ